MNSRIWPEGHPSKLIQLEGADKHLKVVLTYRFLERVAEIALAIGFEEHAVGELEHSTGGDLRANGGGPRCEVDKVDFLLIAVVIMIIVLI